MQKSYDHVKKLAIEYIKNSETSRSVIATAHNLNRHNGRGASSIVSNIEMEYTRRNRSRLPRKKMKVRFSKNPVYSISKTTTRNLKYFSHEDVEYRESLIAYSESDYSLHTMVSRLQELEETYKNWIIADRLKLSPELYHYFYVQTEDKQHYHIVVANEAFSYNLVDFFKSTHYTNLTLEEKNAVHDVIANKIVHLISSSVYDANRIFYDVKPLNTVINIKSLDTIDDNSFDVKLIDWDSNLCKEIEEQDNEEHQTIKTESIQVLLLLIYNIHSIRDMKINLLYNYFRSEETKELLEQVQYDIMDIFLNVTDYAFLTITKYYFFDEKMNGHFLASSDEEMLDIMIRLTNIESEITDPRPPLDRRDLMMDPMSLNSLSNAFIFDASAYETPDSGGKRKSKKLEHI